MTGIVIAAGRGVRLMPYTTDLPKCMLPVNGRPLLVYAIERLRAAGCTRVVVITGHLADRIEAPGCEQVHNAGYEHNNILHSLMYARDYFDDDLLVSYSDIIVEPGVYRSLVATEADILLAVDLDWRGYYVGRSEHPVSEAEKAIVRPVGAGCGVLEAIGKHLSDETVGNRHCAEFTGLWKMSRAGAREFRERFEALDAQPNESRAFRRAPDWRKAYVTDFLGHLVDEGVMVYCLLIERGWAELDAVQDYLRLPTILEAQGLFSLLER